MSKGLTIHIFSVIPHLPEALSKILPAAQVKTVYKSFDCNALVSKKYEKVVTREELEQIKDAKIILGDANLIAQVYTELSDPKWIQCTWAGLEKFVDVVRNGVKPTYPITRMGTQTFSQLMAEYVLGRILNYERGWLDAHKYQLQKTWAHKDNIATYRSLQDLSISVMGVGLIGSEIVRALKYFKCKVTGFGRSPTAPQGLPLDGYCSTSELPQLLADCDYLVNVLPSTPDTKGLLGNGALKGARNKPIFMNIGRGDIIREDEIISALDESLISAAILDVFETEPLPPTSPLWLHPKVLITPHVAGVSRAKDVVNAFSANLELFSRGKQLKNVIDWGRGY